MENKKADLFRGIWMLLPFFIITLFIVISWIDRESFLVFIILFMVTLTAGVAAIVLIILAFRNMKNKWNKAIIIWGVFNILFIGTYFCYHATHSVFAERMAKHYESNKTGIEDICNYFINSIDDGCYVDLMFDKNYEISRLIVRPVGGEDYIEWDYNSNVNSLLLLVGLNDEEVDNIQGKLKKVGCIGICYSDKYDRIDLSWKYRGFDRLSYELLNKPMTEEEKDKALRCGECGIPYNDQVIFHKYGGAMGYIDFPSEDREKFLKKHQPW
ncbi:MAG: hypothetical protein IJK92_07640 [Bacteroidales bacterium]|nr:hypothetical protein [Bacteroidales bacterium]